MTTAQHDPDNSRRRGTAQSHQTQPGPESRREPLWRHMLGQSLRDRRKEAGETLTDVATRAGMSPQYLSEIERGRKEPSSEMIAAIGSALDLTLLDLTTDIARALTAETGTSATRSTAARAGSVTNVAAVVTLPASQQFFALAA